MVCRILLAFVTIWKNNDDPAFTISLAERAFGLLAVTFHDDNRPLRSLLLGVEHLADFRFQLTRACDCPCRVRTSLGTRIVIEQTHRIKALHLGFNASRRGCQ